MRELKKGEIRIRHNWKILIIILFLLIALYFVLVQLKIKLKEKKIECVNDEDCVKQQITCCKCNMGGEERCMPKKNATIWQEKLKKCGKDIMCVALYNCKIKNCVCREGKCVEEY